MNPQDISAFPVLTTPRLVLRELTPADAPELLAFCSDPEVLRYDMDPPLSDLVAAEQLITQSAQDFAGRKAIWWGAALGQSNLLVGEFVFFIDPQEQPLYKADLGYRLARPYWRQGYATEAVAAMLGYAFKVLRVHRVNVDTRIDNPGSVGLMRALGFTHEGTRRECGRNPDGSYHSWALYGMLEEEYWSQARLAGPG